MRKILTLIALFLGLIAYSQNDSTKLRIILIGDAGLAPGGRNAVVDAAMQRFGKDGRRNVIVYLGDNIYPYGLPPKEDKDYKEAFDIIVAQARAGMETDSRVYFIPGNHDWQQGRPGGWAQVRRQQRFIDSLHKPNIRFLPKDGCPGPEEIALDEAVTLVIFDSQWWLHQHAKPSVESDCDCKTRDELITRMEEIAHRNKGKLLIVASHHPFRSNGIHGGYYTLKQHLFPLTDFNPSLYVPLPLIGSIYPIGRGIFGNIQDLPHPQYKKMVREVEEALHTDSMVVHVAGHDHELQLLKEGSYHYIVSGAGAKRSRVKTKSNTRFAKSGYGYAVLEVTQGNRLYARFFSVNGTADSLVHGELLAQGFKAPVAGEIKPRPRLMDTVSTSINTDYNEANSFHRFWLGANYRKDWAAVNKFPVFDITREQGGLKILQRGGGHQTKSLRLEDSSGRQWVLRSMNKFPEAAIPEALRETFAKDIVQDQISAAQPYAPLVVAQLADRMRIPHTHPKIVFVPDDPELGVYQRDFAGTVCLFEEREPVATNVKTYSTDKAFENIIEDNDDQADQQSYLRVRLFDMFIGDWDRHEDQWRWANVSSDKDKQLVAIPRDRDQAFFVNQGLLPRQASRPWLLPYLQGFRKNIPNIKGFSFNARHIDRFMLNELDLPDWQRAAEELERTMSDSVIDSSLHTLPDNIYANSGEVIKQKLIGRRKDLQTKYEKYYRFLSREVDIPGTMKHEYFLVRRKEDESLQIIVYKRNKEGDTSTKIYERVFNPSVTREVRLYGMDGEDVFDVDGTRGRILLRIIGSRDSSSYRFGEGYGARARTIVYDRKGIDVDGLRTKTRLRLSADARVNRYDYRAFKYNRFAPLLSAGYNLDDGVLLGAGFTYTGHSFRKQPQAVTHRFVASHALATEAFRFLYDGSFTDVIGGLDLLLHADVKAPNNTANFFGFGNESVYNDEGPKRNIIFYRTRYRLIDAMATLSSDRTKLIQFSGGAGFQHFKLDETGNRGRFIYSSGSKTDSAFINQSKYFLTGRLQAVVNSRDNVLLPTRGVLWTTAVYGSKGLNDFSRDQIAFSSDFSYLASFWVPARLTLGFRLGGSVSNEDVDFFQAQTLGGLRYLRGFRNDRFYGNARLYSSVEMRLKLFDFSSYIVPGSVGLVGFYDGGRVWYQEESSNVWHSGYGAGLYVTPADLLLLTVNLGFSKEGVLPYISVGFRF